jgi:enoyl-[acyl-carrier protein] reductase I
MNFDGANRVVPEYGLMGPVKAALESAVRYAAAEFAPLDIRAHAISPGSIQTRAAGGIAHFDVMLARAAAAIPGAHEADADQVGALAAFLVGDGARSMTGSVIVVDNGRRMMG